MQSRHTGKSSASLIFRDKVIVLEDDGWQQGIIRIVSSRITERYGLPSVLISFDGAPGDIRAATTPARARAERQGNESG